MHRTTKRRESKIKNNTENIFDRRCVCVCVCAAISHLYISIHLYICICDVCIHIRTIDRASFYSVRFSFVLLSSSYLLANLISNKIICSICGCFYSVCILFCCDCYSVQRLQFRCISNVFLLSRKHNRWVRVEFRTLLYDANRKAKQKKMFISNEIHTLSAMVRGDFAHLNRNTQICEEIEIEQHSCNSSLDLPEIPLTCWSRSP